MQRAYWIDDSRNGILQMISRVCLISITKVSYTVSNSNFDKIT
jgi:hypothetical protein